MTNHKCPYCGAEMTPQRESIGMVRGIDYTYCPKCHARGPEIRTEDGVWEGKQAAALAAAQQRYAEPPKLLTLAELEALDGTPVWCEDRDGSGAWALVIAWDDKCIDADFGDWEFYCYGWTNERGWRAWTKKPSKRALAAWPWEA